MQRELHQVAVNAREVYNLFVCLNVAIFLVRALRTTRAIWLASLVSYRRRTAAVFRLALAPLRFELHVCFLGSDLFRLYARAVCFVGLCI